MGNSLMDKRIEKLVSASENYMAVLSQVVTRFDSMEKRVDSVETQLDHFAIIHSGQCKKLRQAANKRIRELLGDENYKSMRSQYYSWLWTSYQDAFGVTSYSDTRLKHFDAALDWIKEWQPIRSVTMDELKRKTVEKAAAAQ